MVPTLVKSGWESCGEFRAAGSDCLHEQARTAS